MDSQGLMRFAGAVLMAIIGIFLIDRSESSRKGGAFRALLAAAIKTGLGMVAGLMLAYLLVDDQAREAGYRWTHDWIDPFFLKSIIWSGAIGGLSLVLLLMLALSPRQGNSNVS